MRGERKDRLVLINMQEAGSISFLRKHVQKNNIISIQCNSWNEPGVEIFGAKAPKPEEEERKEEEGSRQTEVVRK